MGRKAVQGYTEKSMYDNTRFTGVLATHDPLNEGYFRHMVNLDISDTGQSVAPRKGILTTTLCSADGTQDIALSSQTIVFKNSETQSHIVFDFFNKKAYIVNLDVLPSSAYRIPITREVDSIDWSDVTAYLLNQYAELRALYAAYQLELTIPGFVETDEAEFNASSNKGYAVHSNTPTAAWLDQFYVGVRADDLVVRYDQSDSGTYTYWKTYQRTKSPTEAFADVSSVVVSQLTLYTDTRTVAIRDKALIHKQIIKAVYTPDSTPLRLYLEIYYRNVGSFGLAGNTLVIGVVDTYNHPTYVPTERNLAVPKSIIPTVMQNVYSAAERPNGHISTVSPFLYYKHTLQNTYAVMNVYRNTNYTITPYFDFNPAFLELNNVENINDRWAYCFDITSTRSGVTLTDYRDVVYKSPWVIYKGTDQNPTLARPLSTTVELSQSVRTMNHIKDTRYVIHVVPKDTTSTTSTWMYDIDGNVVSKTDPSTTLAPGTYLTQAGVRDTAWRSVLSTINSVQTLTEAINTLGNSAYFYLYDLHATPALSTSLYGDFEQRLIEYSNEVHSETVGKDKHEAHFLDASELLLRLKTARIFQNGNYVTFHLLPVGCYDTITHAESGGLSYTTHRHWFGVYKNWDNTRDLYTCVYNQHEVGTELFYRNEGGVRTVGSSTAVLRNLANLTQEGFFDNGYQITVYFRPLEHGEPETSSIQDWLLLANSWRASTPYVIADPVRTYGYDDLSVTTIPESLTLEPEDIASAQHFTTYDGDRLVVWTRNTLYISEPGDYYYFKEDGKRVFDERIVKVIQYKTILMVFTVQHLYAVYRLELEQTVGEGEKAQTIKTSVWAQQTVMYNIMTSDQYADAIQIFNQMVLFYSEDGQLFMIKPSTMIDNETRFALQYFNKSANDILVNYDLYMNERLAQYGVHEVVSRATVKVNAIVSVNYIKLIYSAPGLLTYILVYDVINNRYSVYDTLNFHTINDKMFVESGELYLTTRNDKLYFTQSYREPNVLSNHVDLDYTDNFRRVPIHALIDTGNLNLNNHLMKRFRDLHITLKNFNTQELRLNVETVLDDVVSHPFYDQRIEVQDIGGTRYFVTVPKENAAPLVDLNNVNQISEVASNAILYGIQNQLFEHPDILLDLSGYTSSKLITHRSSILGMGKVLRIKMQFVSKGNYKIQTFGIIYKERRV